MNGRKAATIMFILYLGSLAFVYADSVLRFSFTWTTANISIEAYTNADCTEVALREIVLDAVIPGSIQTFEFWIKNEGDIAVDVNVVTISIDGGTASWEPPTLTNLVPDNDMPMTLTLTFEDQIAGSYTFKFEAVKA